MPITVNNFNDISAITLNLEYDSATIAFTGFTANSVFGSAFQVGSNPGTGGSKKKITIGWFGSGVNLPNGSAICTLNFTYVLPNAGASSLTWWDIGPSCEYSTSSGVLVDTPTANYYKNGSVTFPLTANFIADNLSPPKNTTVYFTDLTTGGPTAWSWSFDRTSVLFVNGTSATSQNPQVQFTDGGLYTVTLVAYSGMLSNSTVKAGYLRAGISGVWTGTTSSEWNTLSNWDNYLLPVSTTNVIIPVSAPNWPVFTGNLTLGLHCATLFLSGINSRMTVTGILTIL
jgi:PKD repeat protein